MILPLPFTNDDGFMRSWLFKCAVFQYESYERHKS